MWPHAEQFNDYIPPRGMRVSIPIPLPLPVGTPTCDLPRVPEPLSFPSFGVRDPVDDIRDKGEWIGILHCHRVKLSVILDEP